VSAAFLVKIPVQEKALGAQKNPAAAGREARRATAKRARTRGISADETGFRASPAGVIVE
jgi:hypothetical protein